MKCKYKKNRRIGSNVLSVSKGKKGSGWGGVKMKC